MENKTLAVSAVLALLVAAALGAGVLVGNGLNKTTPAVQVIGAVSGPDLSSPYLAVNGLQENFYSSALNQASTTICSFKSPTSTSTLEAASVQLTTGTSTAILLEIGKSNTNLTATTTRLGIAQLAANAQVTVIASTSPAAADPTIFAPNSYLVFKYGGTSAAEGSVNQLVGSCKARFLKN